MTLWTLLGNNYHQQYRKAWDMYKRVGHPSLSLRSASRENEAHPSRGLSSLGTQPSLLLLVTAFQ